MSTIEVVVRAMLPSVSMCTMRSSVDDQALTRVERLDVSSFVIPTDGHESDGLGGWASSGMSRVKMKVGRAPERDLERVRAARRAIGPDVALFVDANGAYRTKQALRMATGFAEQNVAWFEEPVTSDDLCELRLLRGFGEHDGNTEEDHGGTSS